MTVQLIALLAVAVAAMGSEPDSAAHWAQGQFSGGLDPAIAHVATGGFWETSAQNGIGRIVVLRYGEEHTYTATYAQWLSFDAKIGREREIATVPIKPLNDVVLAIVRDVDLLSNSPGEPITVEMTLIHRYTQKTRKYRIVLRGPGDYSVTDLGESSAK
jgi:hypothetical protein